MNNIKNILAVLVLFIVFGCTKGFEETNQNPNNPEVVNPELLMVTVIRSTVNQMVNEAWSPGNIVSQFSSEIREPNTDRYIWGSFSTWSNGYSVLKDVNNLYDIAEERGLNNYKGIALVLRALIYSRMTDTYGDLPYKEALKGKDDEPVYAPKYDTQQEIYAGLLKELEEANKLLSTAGGVIDNDILNGNNSYVGNPILWKKLANSLKIRLLMRQSNKVNPSQALQEILNNPTQFPIFQSNADNAAVTYVEAPNLFPITSTRIGFWRDRRLSKTLFNQLNITNDPRLQVFAEPTSESVTAFSKGTGPLKWDGVRNGETDANLGSNIDAKVSTLGKMFYVDLAIPVKAEGLVMTFAELNFLLAEAAQKKWITGNPETFYNNGIKASVDYYRTISGVSITATDQFLTSEGIKFNPTKALEQIGTQKWISLFFHDLQAWHEWKRTGFPVLTPSFVNNNGNKIPVRFTYPTAQQTTNRENYQAAVARQGVDDINTKLWWQ
jgi:hypothetical protein